jgi:hypothetical protein
MDGTVYAVVCYDVDVRMQVEACNELAVVAACVIAYKAVKLLNISYSLSTARMIVPWAAPVRWQMGMGCKGLTLRVVARNDFRRIR